MRLPIGFTYNLRLPQGAITGLKIGASVSAIIITAALIPAPAFATDECGPANTGVVVCTAADNPYSNGITYVSVDSLTLTTNPDTSVSGSLAVDGSGIVHIINNGNISTTSYPSYPYVPGLGVTGSASVIIDGTGSITTTGFNSRGIDAATNGAGASIQINVGSVTTIGNGSGGGEGLSAYAPDGTAIFGGTIDGPVSIAAKSISTFGDNATGAYALSRTGNASVTTSGPVTTSGLGSDGLVAQTNYGATATVSSAGAVNTSGEFSQGVAVSAIYGTANANVNVVHTSGYAAQGVFSQGGPAANVKFSSVSTDQDFSIAVVGEADYDVTITGKDAKTMGFRSDAVDANAFYGNASVTTTGQITTGGDDAAGIYAISSAGSATVSVYNVSTTGHDAVGVIASSAAGAATVTVNGAVSSPHAADAIDVLGGTTATLNLSSNASLTTAGGAARLASASGATVNNAGLIIGNSVAPILASTGGAFVLNNAGEFTGIITTGGADVTINNSGTYHVSFDHTLGSGNNIFNNSGKLLVLAEASVAATVNLGGLERLVNSGLVDLRNGHTGDKFVVSGNFVGLGGSALGIDASLAPPGVISTIDHIVVAGAITGSTALLINQAGAGGAVLNSGTVFATGGAGSAPTAFTVSPTSRNTGFIGYTVNFDASDNSYSLSGIPDDAVYRALKISEGAQQLWYKTTDAWSEHMSELRDADFAGNGGNAGRIWGHIYGQTDTRDASQQVSVFGLTRPVNSSYRQDAFGGQLGVDLGSVERNGKPVFGLTGGYLDSDLMFLGSADRVNYSTANVGAYAGVAAGGFFASALADYDYMWIDSKSLLAGYDDKFHGVSYGALGEAGFRIEGKHFYAEPVATIAYVRTDLGNLHALGNTIDFNALRGLRGKAGLRFGGKVGIGGGAIAILYAQGNFVHEFEGKGGISFSSSGMTLNYGNRPIGDYGEGKLGFSVVSAIGVTGFVECFGEDGRSYRGGGGRAGMRVGL